MWHVYTLHCHKLRGIYNTTYPLCCFVRFLMSCLLELNSKQEKKNTWHPTLTGKLKGNCNDDTQQSA